MKTTRTLTLEFVRHGPPHNQLLSPITEYLALCGNHGATSVFLPFEHHEFLLRLSALRYQERRDRPEDAMAVRAAHAREMGQLMSGILGEVPGLKADLGSCPQHPDELIHLQLVVSAAELALLPFEAALTPPGSPGAGKPLSLQTALPMSLTRQVRRAFTPVVHWPTTPRILCAISSAGGVVPGADHVRVLRAAIAPWVRPAEQASAGAPDNVGDMLTVMTDASLEKLSQACSEKAYTHVHILAHGKSFPVVGGTRFGLALHDSRDASKVEVVDGERLALALRSHKHTQGVPLTPPAVVTVASCDSGNVDTLIAPGASLAHALHEAEIPLVVASQFPLTFAGSMVLTHVLYSRLLWGADPRVVLHEARQKLRLLEGEVHDWASVVAYTSFPPDFDSRLWSSQVRQAHAAAEAALARSGRLLEPTGPLTDKEGPAPVAPEAKTIAKLTEELGNLTVARDRLLAALPQERAQAARAAELYGQCGSIEKRRAQIHYHVRQQSKDEGRLRELDLEIRAALERAASYYWEGLQRVLPSQWLATQNLCIRWLLDGKVEARWWRVAQASSRMDLEGSSAESRLWAHASLAEVYLLAPFIEPSPTDVKTEDPTQDLSPETARELALKHAESFAGLADRNSFHLLSTRRQFERYMTWFIPYVREMLEKEHAREVRSGSERSASVKSRLEALSSLQENVREVLKRFPVSTSPAAYSYPTS
ncbi:CHAT domain-containing protein [Pyxidicoccus parkwayensis]|uniref:CHAT domain-containing protein n=1 Tax=Pyxidicoccus parkwayensis TaxID=2813578 RepID=A0ABX7P3W8_9BACT|nr:CHAT domain-containing protein [Pyxidicoccus parkwaysis]QSQ25177.1 CHAT domain-containing protein [Pyxidicoccus parkwaysis]